MTTALPRILVGLIATLLVSGEASPAPPPPPPPPSEDFPVDLWIQYWDRIDEQMVAAHRQVFEQATADVDSDRIVLEVRIGAENYFHWRSFQLASVCPEGQERCELRLTAVHFPTSMDLLTELMERVQSDASEGHNAGLPVEEWRDLTDVFAADFVVAEQMTEDDCPGIIRGLEEIEAIPLRLDWGEVGEDDGRPFVSHPWWYSVDFGFIAIGGAEAELSLSGVNTTQAREIADAYLGELGDCGLRALDDFPVGE